MMEQSERQVIYFKTKAELRKKWGKMHAVYCGCCRRWRVSHIHWRCNCKSAEYLQNSIHFRPRKDRNHVQQSA